MLLNFIDDLFAIGKPAAVPKRSHIEKSAIAAGKIKIGQLGIIGNYQM